MMPHSVVAVIVSMSIYVKCAKIVDHAQSILCRTSTSVAGRNELLVPCCCRQGKFVNATTFRPLAGVEFYLIASQSCWWLMFKVFRLVQMVSRTHTENR
jgi:hypothetical protein